MSAMARHRHALQHRPQYEDGWEAFLRDEPRGHHPWPMGSVEQEAFGCGWDDASDQFRPRVEP